MKNLILIFAFFSLLLSSQLKAQELQDQSDFVAGSDITFGAFKDADKNSDAENSKKIKEISKDTEVTVIEDKYAGQYSDPSLENISKLYWKKNALSINDDEAIDNFMLINECDIYEKFYTDDFEWERIREAGREKIKETKDNFSQKFKMIVPVDLGRYDMQRKGFPLINKSAFKDLRRVEIGGNSNGKAICGYDGVIANYPRNIILILNKPFSYDFMKLDEHIAQAYIIRQKYNEVSRPKEISNKHYDRLAFARIRITFSKYQGETKGQDNYPLGVMFGQLDGIDIFEDADETRLLTSVNYQ